MKVSRKLAFIVLMALVALFAAACGGGGDDDDGGDGGLTAADAEARMEEAFEVLWTFDFDALSEYVCEAERGSLTELQTQFEEQGISELFAMVELDLSAVEYSAEVDGDTATVTLSGEMGMTMAGETQTQPISDLGFDELGMTVEDGNWVICDPNLAGG